MIRAIVKEDNLIYCGKCESLLGGIVDYKLVEVNKVNYTSFIRRCDKCNSHNQYCVLMGLDYHKRFSFSESEMNEIKDN